jgi:hypothetical protein
MKSYVVSLLLHFHALVEKQGMAGRMLAMLEWRVVSGLHP